MTAKKLPRGEASKGWFAFLCVERFGKIVSNDFWTQWVFAKEKQQQKPARSKKTANLFFVCIMCVFVLSEQQRAFHGGAGYEERVYCCIDDNPRDTVSTSDTRMRP